MRMNWVKSDKVKEGLVILMVSVVLLLLVDYLAGYTILKHTPISSRNNAERGVRIKHPVYHHTLAANYDGFARWGNKSEYRFCTNNDGLKVKCGAISHDKSYDIGFLGDSFTEGVSLPYEKTFVGLIAEKLPEKKIANLAVDSYSPTIYYLKLVDFLNKGYQFKELVVYIDISDIRDEANYAMVGGRVITTFNKTKSDMNINDKMFPLLNFGLKGLKNRFRSTVDTDPHMEYLDLNDRVYSRHISNGAWTFDANDAGYGKLGVSGSIKKSIAMMEKLYEVCKKNNIKLSVGVYPWPSQILYDVEESKQVKIWRDFCVNKCANFYNSFPTFFELVRSSDKKAVIGNYFIYGDVHFNESGNQLIAADFFKTYKP